MGSDLPPPQEQQEGEKLAQRMEVRGGEEGKSVPYLKA